MGPDSEILTAAELATFLRCNKATIYRLANAGELPGFKLGSDWRFRVDDIELWLSRLSNANRLHGSPSVPYRRGGKRSR